MKGLKEKLERLVSVRVVFVLLFLSVAGVGRAGVSGGA